MNDCVRRGGESGECGGGEAEIGERKVACVEDDLFGVSEGGEFGRVADSEAVDLGDVGVAGKGPEEVLP